MNLKKQVLSGVFWTLTQQFGVQGINFIVQIILARLLLPEAFGLIAMIQIFMGIGTALMDSGMTSSLIRTKNPDQRDYSTVFYINLGASVLIYILMFLISPFLADFFRQPSLKLITRVYAISFIIQALVGVQTTRLTKEMNFKLQMYMQIPSVIIGGTVGVILAYKGFEVWSLVWMYLITTTIFMLQHWFRSDWRPSFIIDTKKFKYHFDFGYKLTLSALLTAIYKESYTIIIGRLFTAGQLGFYKQADTLSKFPVRNLTGALQKVTYPAFSAIVEDNDKLKEVFKKITLMVFYIVTPIMLCLILISEPLFRLVLTEKWLPSVPFFNILCVGTVFHPLSIYNLNIILAKGRSDLHFKLEALKKIISISFLLLIIPFGIYGAVYAAAIGMLIHAFYNSLYCGRLINYSIYEQFKNLFPIMILAVSSMFFTYCVNLLGWTSNLNDLLQILLTGSLYIFFFITFSLLFKIKEFYEVKELLKNYKKFI